MAFWKALVNLRRLECSVVVDVFPTVEELDGFGEGEGLGRVVKARIAGDFVDWAEPDPINAPRNLFKLAPNLQELTVWVDEKAPPADAVARPLMDPCPTLTSLDIRGHLNQARTHVGALLGSFPNLTKLELKELEPSVSLDGLIDDLDFPLLEELHLTTTGRQTGPAHNGHVVYFGWQPEPDRAPPPPISSSLAKFTALKRLQADCTSQPAWLLTLPKSLELFKATAHSHLALPILARLLTPNSPDHLPHLRTFHSDFQPDELRGDCMWGLQLGRAKVPYLPALPNGDPDFGLRGFWDLTANFGAGEWSFAAFEDVVRLAEGGGVDLGDTPLMFPYTCEARRRAELVVREGLRRRWEAGELVWRVDTKDVARTLGWQKQTGETPEPEPWRSGKRARGTRPEGVPKTKNRKRHRADKR